MGQRQCGTAEKEIINILEKYAGTRVKAQEIPSQGLTEEIGVVLETLKENSSCKLS